MALTKRRNRRKTSPKLAWARALGAVRVGGVAVRLAVALGCLLGMAVLGRFALLLAKHSKAFTVQAIAFHGLNRVREEELLKLSGLAVGQNLLEVDPEVVVRSIASHPWIETVDLTRRPPSKLEIDVVERVAVALVSLGDLYLIDEEARPFKRLSPQDEVDLPLVSGLSREDYLGRPQQVVSLIRTAVEAARAYERLPGASADPLSEVRLSGSGLALVIGRQGTVVELGEGDLDEKLARLARVWSELKDQERFAEVIHLDNRLRPGWVAVKLRALR